MVSFPIPESAQYTDVLAQFTAPFTGTYQFNVPANKNVFPFPMNSGALYVVTRLTVGGSISQESYLANILTVPSIQLSLLSSGRNVLLNPFPLVQFSDGLEVMAKFWTDRHNEFLVMSITQGELSQDTDLVGVTSITLNVCLSVFQIYDADYIRKARQLGGQSASASAGGSVASPRKMMIR
jgi:hypothetical protein